MVKLPKLRRRFSFVPKLIFSISWVCDVVNLLWFEFDFMSFFFTKVTTNSKLITTADVMELSVYLNIPQAQVVLLTLQSFETEQQFCQVIRYVYTSKLCFYCLLVWFSLNKLCSYKVHVVYVCVLARILIHFFSWMLWPFWTLPNWNTLLAQLP